MTTAELMDQLMQVAAETIRTQDNELRQLRKWKAEAMIVLERWDDAYESANVKGKLGQFKGRILVDEIKRLRARIRELDEALSDAEHRLTQR